MILTEFNPSYIVNAGENPLQIPEYLIELKYSMFEISQKDSKVKKITFSRLNELIKNSYSYSHHLIFQNRDGSKYINF